MEEHMDSAPTLTQLKRPRVQEKSAPGKKTKVSKTKDAFEELMTEQTTMLGVLRAQLQALQVRPPRMMTRHVAVGTSEAKQMLRARTMNTLVLPEGAVLAVAKGNKATTSQTKGWGLNLAALPRETLY